MSDPSERRPRFPYSRLIGIAAGPLAAIVVLLSPPPEGLSIQGWWTAAVGIWMAVWWMTEALPLAITAMLPLILFPVLGVRDIESTSPSYAHPLIFLFLGGFLLARAMNVWGLDIRLAMSVLRLAGSNPRRVIAAIMCVTAFLSMWISNTATAMVMLPIGLSIAAAFHGPREGPANGFTPALLLGIAYAATIGGMGTLIGTPPNALFAAFMAESYGMEIGFLEWMLIGVPILLVLLPITWFVLTHLAFDSGAWQPHQDNETVKERLGALPPMSRAERLVAGIMILVAVAWISRPLITAAFPSLQLSDTGIAITGAFLLFVIPADLKSGRFLLHWDEAAVIRWDVLILFGGGLALATAIGESDVADWIGAQLVELKVLPLFMLLLAVGVAVVFVGELASNTAMAAVFLPVAGATALGMGEPVIMLTLPVALFATLGFMLPVATPPNAVIFGSGALKIRHMLRAGVILDIVGILVVAVAVVLLQILHLFDTLHQP